MNPDRNAMIEQHLPLVGMVAKRFHFRNRVHGLEAEDLFSAGCIGLILAVDRFDPTRGLQFSTYAVHMIRTGILRYVRDCGCYGVKIPRMERELFTRIKRLRLLEDDPETIAQRVNCSVALVKRALACYSVAVLSLSYEIYTGADQKTAIEALLPQSDDDSEMVVREFYETLTAMERSVLQLRSAGKLQREIGAEVGCSQFQVCRLLKRVAVKMERYQQAN